jgi:hypothetical protein
VDRPPFTASTSDTVDAVALHLSRVVLSPCPCLIHNLTSNPHDIAENSILVLLPGNPSSWSKVLEAIPVQACSAFDNRDNSIARMKFGCGVRDAGQWRERWRVPEASDH